MRIGIGVTTYNRPECLSQCLYHINKHTDRSNVTLHIATDTDQDRKGVAARKNECLRALKECDYIFLFDDDCWPIKEGWIDFFKGAHYLFLDKEIHQHIWENCYRECGGVFMSLTKSMIDKVGAFNEMFDRWGFEHAEYTQRIHKAGFTPHAYLCRENSGDYLYAADYSDPKHISSISNEEKQKYFDLNFPKFKEPIKNIYIPL